MKSVTRTAPRHCFVRGALFLAVATMALLAPQSGSAVPLNRSAADQGALAGIRPETRLRKLHLVRPDLIPYPIAYEVYC